MPLIIPGDPVTTNPDRDTLRQRIAEALRPGSRDRSGQYPEGLMRDVEAVLAVLSDPTDRAAVRALTQTERDMLRYALDLAEEQMLCVGDEFSEDDHDAIGSLRRLAAEAPTKCGECSHPKDTHREGDDPVTPGTCSVCDADDPDEAHHDFTGAVEGAR